MLPLGKSLNLGVALKQGREISFGWVLHKPVTFLPKISLWAEASDLVLVYLQMELGGRCGSWAAHLTPFRALFCAVAPGFCFFRTCSGGAVRDVSFVGGIASQLPFVIWHHLVR